MAHVKIYRMEGRTCQSNTYIESYKRSKFIYLIGKRGNTNGPQRGTGQIRRVTRREPSFRARSLDKKVQRNTENNLRRMLKRGFERRRPLRVHIQSSLHCPPVRVAKGCVGVKGYIL
mmetsp:Transcript_6890/g.42048  ORF Transcript_6890/g.42048 Transcript_6890/m.42048 type:complete len:117 (+) Transcript_6890:123-473(+)